MINRRVIQKRLSFIASSVSQLDEIATIPLDRFLADTIAVAATESFLRRALEAVFDIGRRVLAKSGHAELAQEYKSIARGLGTINAVPEDLVGTLERMAGYRNRLVHFYHQVTSEELHSIAVFHRGNLRHFMHCIKNFINQEPY